MYQTSKHYSYISYTSRNVRPCTILGYASTTFPKSRKTLLHNQSNRNLWHNCKSNTKQSRNNKNKPPPNCEQIGPCSSPQTSLLLERNEGRHQEALQDLCNMPTTQTRECEIQEEKCQAITSAHGFHLHGLNR